MQGVSINIFVKTKENENEKPAVIHHAEMFGKREVKYENLTLHSLDTLEWKILQPVSPNYFFVKKNFESLEVYNKGFNISEAFNLMSSGIKTHRDHLVVDFDKKALSERIVQFYDVDSFTDSEVQKKFSLKNNSDFKIETARRSDSFNNEKLHLITYRPFDARWIYFDTSLIDRGREKVMNHILQGSICLICFRQSRNNDEGTFFLTKHLVGKDALSSLDTCSVFPLYLYSDQKDKLDLPINNNRTPNLKEAFVKELVESLS
ncbi:MAG: hypothetical protein EOP00_23255, partial [Pedobacter sp.]